MNAVLIIMSFGAWIAMFSAGGDALSASGWGSLKYFTVLSNLYMALVAVPSIIYLVLSLIKKEWIMPSWAKILYFTGVVSVAITFLVVLFFLAPTSENFFIMYKGSNFFFHFLIPVMAICDFILLKPFPEMKFRLTPIGLIPVLLYGIFYICNYYGHWVGQDRDGSMTYDWYNFLAGGDRPIVLVALLMLAASFAICVGLWALNKLGKKIYKEKK